MKIALLGAPGAGKSHLANALVRQLGNDWKVVDKYVEKLAKRTGLEYGPAADYPMNVQVMAERWTAEAERVKVGHNTITCGTIYETLVYMLAVEFLPALNEREMVLQAEYFSLAMRFMGAMEDATANYDLLFYLPWQDHDEHSWLGVVDAKIPEVLEAEFKRFITLTGTKKEKVNAALETIQQVQNSIGAPGASETD